jgi:hypothetical protein
VPGDYHFDELLGGECLEPFTGPWQDDYTVVDCTVPHGGQLVKIGEFPLPEETGFEPYPGQEELQARALALCQGPKIFAPEIKNLKKDAVISVSYTLTMEEWDAGDRSYSCFVSRASGEPITFDVALPQKAPKPAETDAPAP